MLSVPFVRGVFFCLAESSCRVLVDVCFSPRWSPSSLRMAIWRGRRRRHGAQRRGRGFQRSRIPIRPDPIRRPWRVLLLFGRGAFGVAGDVALDVLVELGAVVLVLVGDAGLEGVFGVGLDEELAHGLEDGADAAGGLPVLGLEHAEADVAEAVVGHVGVVDARREVHLRRLEGVVGRQRHRDVVHAARVGRALRPREHDLPLAQVGLGRQAHCHPLRRRLRALLELLLGAEASASLSLCVFCEGRDGGWGRCVVHAYLCYPFLRSGHGAQVTAQLRLLLGGVDDIR